MSLTNCINSTFSDIDKDIRYITNREIKLSISDMPLTIWFEGRKKYVIKYTRNGKLIMNKDE